MTRELERKNWLAIACRYYLIVLCTPAINNPNAIASLSGLGTPKLVFAGSHKLPGAVCFERPSMRTTATSIVDDMIPRMDVKDRSDRGRKTVGIKLKNLFESTRNAEGKNGGVHDSTKCFVDICRKVRKDGMEGIPIERHEENTTKYMSKGRRFFAEPTRQKRVPSRTVG